MLRFQASQSELPTKIRWACGEVWNFLRAAQVKTAGRHVAIYHDGVINVECGAEVDEPFTSDGRVVVSATPAGRVATAAHMGRTTYSAVAAPAIRKPVRRKATAWPAPIGKSTATGPTIPRNSARMSFIC